MLYGRQNIVLAPWPDPIEGSMRAQRYTESTDDIPPEFEREDGLVCMAKTPEKGAISRSPVAGLNREQGIDRAERAV